MNLWSWLIYVRLVDMSLNDKFTSVFLDSGDCLGCTTTSLSQRIVLSWPAVLRKLNLMGWDFCTRFSSYMALSRPAFIQISHTFITYAISSTGLSTSLAF